MVIKKKWDIEHFWAGPKETTQIYKLAYEVMDSMILLTLPNYVILDENGKIKNNIPAAEYSESLIDELIKK